jgi:valyl-tRNA synthetase
MRWSALTATAASSKSCGTLLGFAQMHIKESEPGIVVVADDPGKLALPHRWILSRISTTTAEVRKALDGYDFNLIASAIYQFTWHEFCDWYVEW